MIQLNLLYKHFMLVEVFKNVKKYLVNYCIGQLLSMKSQSISSNETITTSQILFKNKRTENK
jgi:hypothetical protein